MKSLKHKRLVLSGKDEEEVIQKAANYLRVSHEQIQLNVIEKGRSGFLGLFQRDAKYEVEAIRTPEEVAELFLSGCIEKIDLDIEIEILPSNDMDKRAIELKGDRLGLLIGKQGRTLNALQYLTNKVVNHGDQPGAYIQLDANGYRQKRETMIKKLVKDSVENAKEGNQSITLNPMNASDRKLVHHLVDEISDVTTESRGREPNRYVVISPVYNQSNESYPLD